MSKNIRKDSPKILGLDVSTKVIGVALFDIQTKNLLELTHVSPVSKVKVESKIEELILKSQIFRKKLEEYVNFGITYVVIEEPLLNSNNVYTVGCGGLSIRRKNKMLEIINNTNYYNQNNHLPEDVFFFNYPNIKKASFEEANNFCSGMVFSENPVGMHQTFAFISNKELNILEKHFSKIKELEYKYLNLPIWKEYNNIDMIFNNVKIYSDNNYLSKHSIKFLKLISILKT
jgi:hypothetical protein